MIWTWLLIGTAIGLLLAIPLAWVWSNTTAQRVRHLEQRARAAERLAELGTMTGGLAHEIKNPLSTLGLNVQLLQEDLEQLKDTLPEPRYAALSRRLDALGRETLRLRETLEDFLRFAGRMELDLTPLPVNRIVDELADFFEPEAQTQGIRLRRQLAASPDTAPLDASLFKQALLNLLINATQAMANARLKEQAHGGANELLLRTERGRRDGQELIRVHITDTGPGITEDAADRIFQPYFSTKAGGTGLGLPTTRRIIEEHGGQITVHTTPGQGTSFTIELPC